MKYFNEDIAFSELTWQRDEEFRDRATRRDEEREMQDWQLEDAALLDQARREAAELNQWPITCDGSGIIDEYYIDVDQTQVTRCKGCPACDLELVEFGVSRMGVESEIERATRRGARRVA